jgi:predicted ester cyclase
VQVARLTLWLLVAVVLAAVAGTAPAGGLIVASGDWIATEHVGRGTHTAPFVKFDGDVPASNRSIETLFAEFFRLRDGKVVEFRAYWDSGAVLRQMR